MWGQLNLARCFARVLGVVAISAAALGSGAAWAQLQPEAHLGSRIPVKPEVVPKDRVQEVKAKFAACVIEKRRAMASAFVLDRTKLALDSKFDSLADGDCLLEAYGSPVDEVGLVMKGDTMRFALAEALLGNEINSIDPMQLPQAARLDLPVLKAADYEPKTGRQYSAEEMKALDESRARDQLSLIMYRFGDCVVRTDPKGSRALLLAAAGSDSEGASFQALMPAFQQCLEKGAQLKFDRAVLRGALAFSYYSLAHALKQTANAAH